MWTDLVSRSFSVKLFIMDMSLMKVYEFYSITIPLCCSATSVIASLCSGTFVAAAPFMFLTLHCYLLISSQLLLHLLIPFLVWNSDEFRKVGGLLFGHQ
jgi:hypothetical protein